MDVGAMTPFYGGLKNEKNLMEFYERVSGARMHAAYFDLEVFTTDLPKGLLTDI
jgi:NADH dehydrogenase (ubiquinone) Fe-S protein 2